MNVWNSRFIVVIVVVVAVVVAVVVVRCRSLLQRCGVAAFAALLCCHFRSFLRLPPSAFRCQLLVVVTQCPLSAIHSPTVHCPSSIVHQESSFLPFCRVSCHRQERRVSKCLTYLRAGVSTRPPHDQHPRSLLTAHHHSAFVDRNLSLHGHTRYCQWQAAVLRCYGACCVFDWGVVPRWHSHNSCVEKCWRRRDH